MRIIDCSSDVCSSDLRRPTPAAAMPPHSGRRRTGIRRSEWRSSIPLQYEAIDLSDDAARAARIGIGGDAEVGNAPQPLFQRDCHFRARQFLTGAHVRPAAERGVTPAATAEIDIHRAGVDTRIETMTSEEHTSALQSLM